MGEAIGAILAPAVGVAISPVPIIAVILMLFSKRLTANSLSFLFGWVLGLLGAGLIVLALGVTASDGAPFDHQRSGQDRHRRVVHRAGRPPVAEPTDGRGRGTAAGMDGGDRRLRQCQVVRDRRPVVGGSTRRTSG